MSTTDSAAMAIAAIRAALRNATACSVNELIAQRDELKAKVAAQGIVVPHEGIVALNHERVEV